MPRATDFPADSARSKTLFPRGDPRHRLCSPWFIAQITKKKITEKGKEASMDKGLVPRTSIVVNTGRARVWDALVNPALIKKYMFGTDVDSTWREGAPIVSARYLARQIVRRQGSNPYLRTRQRPFLQSFQPAVGVAGRSGKLPYRVDTAFGRRPGGSRFAEPGQQPVGRRARPFGKELGDGPDRPQENRGRIVPRCL
jgi:hypothetical protein